MSSPTQSKQQETQSGKFGEPWRVRDLDEQPYLDIEIEDNTRERICRLWIDDAPVEDFNREQGKRSRRIVACVNALAPFANPGAVAEVVAALRGLVGGLAIERSVLDSIFSVSTIERLAESRTMTDAMAERARAALAKLDGEAQR